MNTLFHVPLPSEVDVASVSSFFEISEELLQEEGMLTIYSLQVEGEDTFILLTRGGVSSMVWTAYIISRNARKYLMCDVHWGWTQTLENCNTLVTYLSKQGFDQASEVFGSVPMKCIGFDAAHSGDKTYYAKGKPHPWETYRTKDYMLNEVLNVLTPQIVASFRDIRSLCNGTNVEKGYALLALLLNRYESSDLCRDYLKSWHTHLHRDQVREYAGAVLNRERFWETQDTRLLFAATTDFPKFIGRFEWGAAQLTSERVDFMVRHLEERF